ncbi:hypothetical protein DSL72_009519 [Monilinia vaccinii-corymbosi]|uniref:Uncharacterized protein n=1 Tax=Monilinia vaccinii-corymbosi TaxID=61207 RepID=A0A8A3PRF4_9HELO|nr:hypothetical protein DSL72_009519 [Monilinia vaccinii-corymbosi]
MPGTSELTETTSSINDPVDGKPKRTNSWDTRDAIAYDVSLQELSKTERKKVIEGNYTCVKIPKRHQDQMFSQLGSLGFKVALERYRGNIDEIWVKGIAQHVL